MLRKEGDERKEGMTTCFFWGIQPIAASLTVIVRHCNTFSL